MHSLLKGYYVLVDNPTDKPFTRTQAGQRGGKVVRGLGQDYEGHSGPLRGNSPHGAQSEKRKRTLSLPRRAAGRVFDALLLALAIVGRAFLVVGRVVGYALLIVAAVAVAIALGACIAVALEYLVGWPDTWWL